MSRQLKAFYTYTCERCNRKESIGTTAKEGFLTDYVLVHKIRPVGWKRIDSKDFCDNCSKLVQFAMGTSASL